MNRRKRNVGHGLYYHSSIPKALVIKPSNIRIWIHDKDTDKLMKVVLEGHGQKLRSEVSSNAKVKRFLEYVPHFMGLIKSIHTAVVENNIELLRAKTSPPVPPQMLACKDSNGLTPLHKAAGLGHTKIVEYLLETWPNVVQEYDNSGKTPLHYAASVRSNDRTYNLLVQAGADPTVTDKKGRTPAFYKKAKNSEDVDRSLLTVIPDAPRIAEQGFPPHFSWDTLPAKFYQAPLKFSHSELNLSRNTESLMKQSNSAFEILSRSENDDEVQGTERPMSFSKKDLNNNSAKSNGTGEMNDDDDVETVETAETETLIPDDKIPMNYMNGNGEHEQEEAQDDPSNETDNNSEEVNNEIDVNNSNEFVESEDAQPDEKGEELAENGDGEEEAPENGADNPENEDLENEPEEQELEDADQEIEDENQEIEDENQEIEAENPDFAAENNLESEDLETEPENQENEDQENKPEEPETNDLETDEAPIFENDMQSVTSDGDEQTIINNDSAYDTNGADNASRVQSSDTNDNENENIDINNLDDDENIDILVIDQDNLNEEPPTSDQEIENIELNSQEMVVSDDDNDDVVVSADHNTRETGDSTIANDTNEEQMDDDDEYDEENDVGSPSPPFEGIVHEEPEKQNESQGREFERRDEENGEPFKQEDDVQKIINSGDMEQLAVIVLNGDGKQLIGRTSSQPDIQSFLDNVSIYMGKIHKVHAAAREGSLRDLQAALDRRKFSTAKDEISPNGTTPLHVAIIFGHTAIIRYLGSRFPETLSATDDENRTALHYAATIKDNGHFYNLLVTLGANPKATDNYGKTAEFYLNHDESDKILSHKDLLRSFGAAEELADEMLNDQVPDDYHSARRRLDDPDVLSTLERCYRLIHEKRSSVFDQTVVSRNGSFPSSASSQRLSVTSYLSKFLKRPIFDKIKHRQTRLDHNLFDIIWPAMKKTSHERSIDEDLNAGVVAPDFDVYVVFQEFFVPLIKDLHGMNQKDNLKEHPKMDFFPPYFEPDDVVHSPIRMDRNEPDDIQWNLDTHGKWVTGGVVECCRNLEDFELPLNLTIGKIEQSERIMTGKLLSKEFAAAISEDGLGQYYTMNEVLESPSEIRTILATNGLLVPLLNQQDQQQMPESHAINGPYYPYGRGVYISASRTLVAWVNVQEHLRILCCTPLSQVADIGIAYSKVGRAVMFLENVLNFRHSYFLGYLSSRPSYLGTSLRLTVTLELPQLSKDIENLRQLCLIRGLHMKTRSNFDSILVSNTQCMNTTEWKLLQEFCSAISNILQLEKDLSMSNSMHIAETLLKIFRKKKSLANINE